MTNIRYGSQWPVVVSQEDFSCDKLFSFKQAMACKICTGACDRVKGSNRSVPEDQRKKNMGLLAAAFVGHTECLGEFIKAGANVNCTDKSFNKECQNNLSMEAKCSFEYDHQDRTSWTPLIHAVRRGDQEITELLLKAGAYVNYAQGSETALVCAVGKCDHKLVEILVKQGADVKITNKNPKVEPPIVRAVAVGSTECLEMLLNSGADVNISYSSICGNTTPILKSVECGILKCLPLLLEAGADVNLPAGGRSPIHEATIKGNIECLNILIKAGADVNLKGKGKTLIHEATIKGNIKCLDKLVEAGADVNSRDIRGTTPVLTAVYLGKTKIVEQLVRLGADVNIPNKYGSTPLRAAVADWYFNFRRCMSDDHYCILVLLKAGADVKPVINKRFSFRAALFSATKYGGVAFVRVVLKMVPR